jgi:hypothetical protein
MENAKFLDNLTAVAGNINTGNIIGLDKDNKTHGYTVV